MPKVKQYDWSKLKPKSPDLLLEMPKDSHLSDIGNWKVKTIKIEVKS